MKPIFLLDTQTPIQGKDDIGGKGAAIQSLALGGFTVPPTAYISSNVYKQFVESNGLGEKILLELNRKSLSENRWEEIWDTSLRIRSFFLAEPLPKDIEKSIIDFVDTHFPDKSLAVRSSAPDEDHQDASFAGLHESYVNIKGGIDVVEHVKKVWASLWSDRALLYRQEMGLQVEKSTMAVIVQELIAGTSSGIVFSQNPTDNSQIIIESVHGLNQGLVDGEVEPDRWIIDRKDTSQVQHTAPSSRDKIAVANQNGVIISALEDDRVRQTPITNKTVADLCNKALKIEHHFHAPQDIEWTLADSNLYILQSRPITAVQQGDNKDKRSWYLSLTRSFTNLCQLRTSIEEQSLPQMEEEAASFASVEVAKLTNSKLAQEIERRTAANEKWVKTYCDDFIPFAHGVRLFGQVYNDLIKPKDPYEFVQLLAGEKMLSTSRNNLLMEIASLVKSRPLLKKQLLKSSIEQIGDKDFLSIFEQLNSQFGNPFNLFNVSGSVDKNCEKKLISVILEYSELSDNVKPKSRPNKYTLEKEFLEKMKISSFPFSGIDILTLGRASYRLRDDDNIVLGKIELQVEYAVREARSRLIERGVSWAVELNTIEIAELLISKKIPRAPLYSSQKTKKEEKINVRARQLVGQPASVGIAKAKARVIDSSMQLEQFKRGEVLVVDAIDPNMTFIAPLAAAIVERRGGMLIHGAIIAREYGIPCVTGIPDVTKLIKTGDVLSVDGYLGIVTVTQANRNEAYEN